MSGHGPADQEDVGFLAGLEHAELGVDGAVLGADPVGPRFGAVQGAVPAGPAVAGLGQVGVLVQGRLEPAALQEIGFVVVELAAAAAHGGRAERVVLSHWRVSSEKEGRTEPGHGA